MRTSRSHADRPIKRWSTGGCTTWSGISSSRNRWLPSQASTQTQGIPGSTSQLPFARTPPQGPLRIFFGQFIGHYSPVKPTMHWPQFCESSRKPLVTDSIFMNGLSSRA